MNNKFEEEILQAIIQISNPNNQGIQLVDNFFLQASNDPLFIETLFKINMNEQYPHNARLQAILLIHKNLQPSWIKGKDGKTTIFHLDLLKERIIDAITYYINQRQFCKTYEEILYQLIFQYFPKNWPDLIEQIVQKLKSFKNEESVYGALRAIYSIFKAFSQNPEANKNAQILLIEQLFPYLESFIVKCCKSNLENLLTNCLKSNSDGMFRIISIIIKIFHKVIFIGLKSYLKDENLKIWAIFLWNSIDCEIGQDSMVQASTWNEMFQLEKHPLFELKIEAMKAIVKLTSLFSINSENYSNLFDTYMGILPALIDSGLIYLNKTLQQPGFPFSQFLMSEIYRLLFYAIQIHFKYFSLFNENLLRWIVYEIAIYHITISPFEKDLFLNDIKQYIYSEIQSNQEPVMSLKQSAGEMLFIIAKNDQKFVTEFLNFAKNMIEGVNLQNNGTVDDFMKEGVLFALEKSIEFIMDDLDRKMDTFLQNIVVPALLSNNIFLQARACSIISTLVQCEINDISMIMQICTKVCEYLTNENLFLRVKSIKAFTLMITMTETHPHIKNDLQIVLKIIFETMQEIQIEDLSEGLKNIVCEFQEEIQPFAIELTSNLLQNFWEVSKNRGNYVNPDDVIEQDFNEQLESYLTTIGHILWCDLNEEFYVNSLNWFTEIMAYVFTNKIVSQLFEYVLDLMNIFLYQMKDYNEQVYFFFPVICYTIVGQPKTNVLQNIPILTDSQKLLIFTDLSFCHENCNSYDKYMGILGNFVKKGYQIILNSNDFYGKSLLEYLFDIVDFLQAKALKDLIDLDFLYAIKILSFIYENNFQYLVQNKPVILEVICKYYKYYLELNRSSLLKSTVLQKFCQMIYFDANYTLNLLKKLSMFEQVIYAIFGNLDLYQDVDEKENFLLNCVGLFSLPESSFPSIIPLDSLMKETLKSMKFLVEQSEKQENFVEEEVIVDDDITDASDDKSWNEDDCLEMDEINYDSPFDDISAVQELQNVFVLIEKENPKYFSRILDQLSPMEKTNLKKCFDFLIKVN